MVLLFAEFVAGGGRLLAVIGVLRIGVKCSGGGVNGNGVGRGVLTLGCGSGRFLWVCRYIVWTAR